MNFVMSFATRAFFFSALIQVVASTTPGVAGELRFQIDPAVNLGQLSQSGEIETRVTRDGDLIVSDASAVVSADPEKLLSASTDFNRYPDMGIPHVKESKILPGSTPDILYTWTSMEMTGRSSKHYLEVRVARNLNSAKAMGTSWQQIRRQGSWSHPDDSTFEQLNGSWYIEPIGNGKVYVRYFLYAKLDTRIPGFLLDLIAKRQFRNGVKDIIRILAREASARR
jgi:ribosome-associated toxin RatA of RatAB toxin-antitoxin module